MSINIIAGIATHPPRSDMVFSAVASLAHQVDILYINLQEYDYIPDWIFKFRNVFPLLDTKGLYQERGKFALTNHVNGYYFSVDDDIIYPGNYVETLIAALKKYKDKCLVCVHGSKLLHPFKDYYTSRQIYHMESHLENDTPVDIPGTGTCAWHTDSIDIPWRQFDCAYMSDVWISGFLHEKNIDAICIAHQQHWLKPLHTAEDIYNTVRDNKELSKRKTELVKRFFPDELPPTKVVSGS
jgi:hypothetical protein